MLEVGAGTGRATTHFAAWGNPFVVLEPAPAMADAARRNLAAFDNVDVRTTTFEDADLPRNTFGLAACAQAWHWLDEATRVQRFADALYAHGTAAIIANVQVNPPEHLAFWERAQDVYRKHTPGMEHKGPFRAPDDIPEHPLARSSLFEDLEQVTRAWEWTLNTDDYLALCSTHSNKAALDPATREALFDGLRDLIDTEFDGAITEHYVAVAGLGRRV
jgi:SAM-dependent methyltransferase